MFFKRRAVKTARLCLLVEGVKTMKKVAFEEHLGTEEVVALTVKQLAEKGTVTGFDPEVTKRVNFLCCDVEEERIPDMEKHDIAMQVLQNSSSGIQFVKDEKEAIALSKSFNDCMAAVVAAHPDKFAALGTLPLQCPEAAAEELERCVKDLGFKGASITGRNQADGRFIDEPDFDCVWKAAHELNASLYIHPTETFPDMMTAYEGRRALVGATFSWGVDTATYVSRIIFGGIFDRFPNVTLIVGHMGEMLPYALERMDSHWNIAKMDSKNEKYPSEYFRSNIYITTSGSFSQPALKCAIEAIGDDRILFGVDYPFEKNEEGCKFIDTADISESSRGKICYENAGKILGNLTF